tara:strand:- start:1227 stop:1394 length:168 start_codon:yes stop_codon:yes gene_type:complete
MNDQQKETLRDCFEGCMSLNHALAILDLNTIQADKATAIWRKWQYEIDEIGHYTF